MRRAFLLDWVYVPIAFAALIAFAFSVVVHRIVSVELLYVIFRLCRLGRLVPSCCLFVWQPGDAALRVFFVAGGWSHCERSSPTKTLLQLTCKRTAFLLCVHFVPGCTRLRFT